jgi:hypothetical protein
VLPVDAICYALFPNSSKYDSTSASSTGLGHIQVVEVVREAMSG